MLYRVLLGSPLANIGAFARAATPAEAVSQRVVVVVPSLTIVGAVLPAGVPYWLYFVATFKADEIQLVVALLPCRKEYGYQVPFGD
jgi:hypothetical protein